jgi:hypothetical protein
MRTCSLCRKPAELRPYGLNAALICFPCMKADPTLEAHATSVVGKMMAGDGHMVIDSGGLRKPTYLEAVLIQELSELSSSPEVK